jgi:hypothetical protein
VKAAEVVVAAIRSGARPSWATDTETAVERDARHAIAALSERAGGGAFAVLDGVLMSVVALPGHAAEDREGGEVSVAAFNKSRPVPDGHRPLYDLRPIPTEEPAP